jgi:hypothetical protein
MVLWIAAAAILGVGCDHSLDSIQGFELGEPTSAVFGFSSDREVMVVFSDMPDLCPLLWDTNPPPYDDYWVLSAWSLSAYRTETAISAYSYVAMSDYGLEWDDEGRGSLELSTIEDDRVEGVVDLTFGQDEIHARFEAWYCDAHLFQGLEDS